ncbi:MAG: prolyl oligopeptidase family serine peptidase [Planctomycetota bacterium]
MLAAALMLTLAGDAAPPKGKALEDTIKSYLAADEAEQARMRSRFDDELQPLKDKELDRLRAEILKIVNAAGSRLKYSQYINYLLDESARRGKYIVDGKPGKVLFIGLHGGGAGSGDAESAAGAMGGGGWFWLFPEVLEKTEHGWTDSGTEEFVMQLIEAAKHTGRVDPNHIYITGHSMGGYGSWTLGAHHADVFAGAAPYAGAPSPLFKSPTDQSVVGIVDGVIPSLCNLPLHIYQSLDDPQVPPATNVFANQELLRWKAAHPGGFDFQYEEVNGRGHGAPQEGYMPSLQWLAKHERNARPKTILWQPVLDWKKHFYWLYWHKPRRGAILKVEAKEGNVIDVAVLNDPKDLKGLSILLGAPVVDLSKPVTINVNGAQRFQGTVARTFSTLLLTMSRNDASLLFDARVDL